MLVDTSVWIAGFRRREPVDFESQVQFGDVVTCPPIAQEVPQGFRDEAAYRRATEAMFALPIVESPLGEGVVRDAVGLYRTAWRHGLTIRSSMDCPIAACELRHDLEVLHPDRDFPSLAKVSSLRQRTWKG